MGTSHLAGSLRGKGASRQLNEGMWARRPQARLLFVVFVSASALAAGAAGASGWGCIASSMHELRDT